MIEGSVNSAREAIIPLRLYGANGQAFDISAVVDRVAIQAKAQ